MTLPLRRDDQDELPHPLQVEWDTDLRGGNPLDWAEYGAVSGGRDSVITGRAAIDPSRTDSRYVLIAGRFEHLGGSMGAVHGEKVVRAYRRATIEKLPVVVVSASGAARIQEGMVALAQLARTSGAARAHARAGLLSLAVMRHPTTGGVLASYASLTDLRAAEPGALVSFAGSRTAAGVGHDPHQTTAEDAFERGFVDALVERPEQGAWIEHALGLRDQPLAVPPVPAAGDEQLELTGESEAWMEVRRARAADRLSGVDHAARLCDSWTELRGSNQTVRAGLTRIGRRRAVVIANDRRAGTGHVKAGGFQLVRRAVALAGHLGVPLLSLVDTPGADPADTGIAAEIAATFAAMIDVNVPTVAVCVGEGGGDGAFALATCDRLLMLEHSVFSVIAPEGAAADLGQTVSTVPEFAGRLRLTAPDVAELGLADAVVSEADAAGVDAAITDALDNARPGDRLGRLERATKRWLR